MSQMHITTIEQRDTDGGPLMGFQATCSCGWVGDAFHEAHDADEQASKHRRMAPIVDAGDARG